MAYNVDLQTNYPKSSYNWVGGRGKTIYTSGCCPSSLRNILVNLCGTKTSIKEMCSLARSCGARVDGGTIPSTLLSAAKKKYGGFVYEYTTSDSKARKHAATGGMCLCHTTGSNKVFSNSGHFVAMVAATSNRVTIIDPYITSKKWSIYGRKSKVTTSSTKGVVSVSPVTSDASFDYYYMISKASENHTNSATKTEKVEDMTEAEVKKIIADEANKQAKLAVSDWAKSVWTDAVAAGILDNDRPQAPLTRQEFAIVLKKIGVFGRNAEPSSWAKTAFSAATEAGILDGSDPHAYVSREMLAQVLKNLGFIGTGTSK